MKNNLCLDIEELHQVREWLKHRGKAYKCPFEELADVEGVAREWFCARVCSQMFPKVRPWEYVCPCDKYNKSYVVRKARIVLARKGYLGRKKKNARGN